MLSLLYMILVFVLLGSGVVALAHCDGVETSSVVVSMVTDILKLSVGAPEGRFLYLSCYIYHKLRLCYLSAKWSLFLSEIPRMRKMKIMGLYNFVDEEIFKKILLTGFLHKLTAVLNYV